MFAQSDSAEGRSRHFPAEAVQDRDAEARTQLHLRSVPDPRRGPTHGGLPSPARSGARAQPGYRQSARFLSGTWPHSLSGKTARSNAEAICLSPRSEIRQLKENLKGSDIQNYLISQPSLDISPDWILHISDQVTKYI
jgi:hypothetical protein